MRQMLSFLILVGLALGAGQPNPPAWPTQREQMRLRQDWLKLRLERHLPPILRRYGIPMWIVVCREYHEDPVYPFLVSPLEPTAFRRTILVFHDRGAQGVERLVIGGDDSGGLYTPLVDPALRAQLPSGEWQWALLRKVVEERKPARIAVNVSKRSALGDGLSLNEHEGLMAALGPKWEPRVVREDRIALDYQASRPVEMLPAYRTLMRTAHELIGRAFSAEVIHPGRTTTEEVVWWLREEAVRRGFGLWFHPTVDLQRRGKTPTTPVPEKTGDVILPGDVLHVDFGLIGMGLCTDTQHMGYVLAPGETEAPAGLRAVLKGMNRFQDLVLERLRPGRSGNEVLLDSLAAARREGLEAALYGHPVGDHGHAAGPSLGLWDKQEATLGGELTVLEDGWFSVELNTAAPLAEWNGQKLRIYGEEDVAILAGRAAWVLRRQEAFHLIRWEAAPAKP